MERNDDDAYDPEIRAHVYIGDFGTEEADLSTVWEFEHESDDEGECQQVTTAKPTPHGLPHGHQNATTIATTTTTTTTRTNILTTANPHPIAIHIAPDIVIDSYVEAS